MSHETASPWPRPRPGCAVDSVDARDMKAVTYFEMALEETGEGWHAYVVFDP